MGCATPWWCQAWRTSTCTWQVIRTRDINFDINPSPTTISIWLWFWDHAASACDDAASVSRGHTQEYVKPDDHTVSACVNNDLPGVMLPVGSAKASFSKAHKKRKLVGYAVHEHIGGGTFGYVYRAEWIQPSLRQHVAIKLLHKTGIFVNGDCRHAQGNCYLEIFKMNTPRSRCDCVAGN